MPRRSYKPNHNSKNELNRKKKQVERSEECASLTVALVDGATNRYTKCCCCFSFLFNNDDIVYCPCSEIRAYVQKCAGPNYVKTTQLNTIALYHPQTLLPTCKRCNAYTQRQKYNTSSQYPPHPIMVVIQYLISGGSTTAPDKRSIAPIMRALCKRIRFPCGMLQYNELVMHGSQTLQTIVKWVHEEKVSVEKFQVCPFHNTARLLVCET